MSAFPNTPRFDDGKAPDALRTIGEVSAAFGIKQHILRYWEEQFPMLKPLKRSGGRRYYRPEDIALLAEINRLVNREGYTIKGARQALNGAEAAQKSVELTPAVVDVLSQLRAIRARLAGALEAA